MSSTVTIQPLADRVVLEVIDETQQTAGGIFIPDSAREKPQSAKVIAVGPGRTENGVLVVPTVQVGQTVLFTKYAGTDVKLGSQDYKIVSEKDILAIV
ncbi:MAG: co-chaperone GroES [Vampirovibrionales bacterium]|jgi:chaperonin GroES|nr:co-chaperone GroES [Vampirovibrionales bacterium]